MSWSAGVFLYWGPGSWCQLSIIDPGAGRYYTAEATGAQPMEHYLDRCDPAVAHWLRVELARDGVRFYARAEDADEWTSLRVVRRPQKWSGPPELLILGKGYGSTHDPAYSAPDLDNDYLLDPGPEVECWFGEVTVEPTPPGRQKLRRDELLPKGDEVGEELLARPGDPTFEDVAELYPPLKHVREAVGTKWHPEEVGITETGGLELGAVTVDGVSQPVFGAITVGDDYTPFGSGPEPPDKRLLDGYLPIVVAAWDHDGVTYEQTVVGYSDEFSDRAPLNALVHLRATSHTGPRSVRVGFRVSPKAAGCMSTEDMLEVPAEGSETWGVRVPCPVTFGSAVEEICACEVQAAMLATRRFWEGEFEGRMRVSVPDQRLTDGYRAWLAYNAIDVDRVGELYEPHDGAGFYEQVYGYSAARYAWVLDLYGFHDDAESVLKTLIAHQTPEGLLSWNFGLTDTGTLLIAMAVHFETTRDADWLRANAPAALKACEWLTSHRADVTDAEAPLRGLIKYRSYCDYAAPVNSYLHNCYCAAGMTRIAEGLLAAGMKREAAPIAREAAAYRRDVLASMRASAIDVNGRRVIPMEPDTHRLLKATDYASRDYYGLVASTLLECGFPAPRSPEAEAIARFLREAGGIRLGTSEFVGGIDHAYGYGYMQHQLLHGRVECYLLGVYTSLAYGMSRGTYSSVECTQHTTGENAMTLPHLYSGTQQLFMLRTMLLREEGDELILCSAVPRAWLADGEVIQVRNAPTRFGPAGFRIKSDVERGRIGATIDPPARRGPSRIVLHLRHPEGRAISCVTVNGRPCTTFDAETVTLSPNGDELRIIAEYE